MSIKRSDTTVVQENSRPCPSARLSRVMASEAHSARPMPMETTMQYLLMLYFDDTTWPKMTPEQQQEGNAAYMAYTEALAKSGILVGANRLQPSTSATTIRLEDGKPKVLDGPYADAKEQLGGYYLIEAPDLDAALSWASRCPTVGHGTVEVRPVWPTG